MSKAHREKIVMSLGGSLVSVAGEVNTDFLKGFNCLIRRMLAEKPDRQFFIVVGGGHIARQYRDAGKEVIGHELTNDDLDRIGIHATRLNAHLLRTIFRDLAHPFVLKDYSIIQRVGKPIAIGAGWKPGWSTDFCAVQVALSYGADTVLNLSNITQYYDKDPKKYPDAKPFKEITWERFRILSGSPEWTPGMNTPFDPVAAGAAGEHDMTVVIMKGDDLENLEDYINNRPFVGTTIKGIFEAK